jgi:hypothetical protein
MKMNSTIAAGIFLTLSACVQPQSVHLVENDMGGLIYDRITSINMFEADKNTRVEIKGECISACTLYITLERVCTYPNTIFGFHGPSNFGTPLEKNEFEYWSMVMVYYYPMALRHWFMNFARHKIVGYYEKTGSELISMGVIKECS